MKKHLRIVTAITALTAAMSASVATSAPPTVKNIVLVHGAFADGSG